MKKAFFISTIYCLLVCLNGCKQDTSGLPYYSDIAWGVDCMYDYILNQSIDSVNLRLVKFSNGTCEGEKISHIDGYDKEYTYLVPYSYREPGTWEANGYFTYYVYTRGDTVKYAELFLGGHDMEYAKDSVAYWLYHMSHDGAWRFDWYIWRADTSQRWWKDYSLSVEWNPSSEYSIGHGGWKRAEYSTMSYSIDQCIAAGRQYIGDSIPAEHDFSGEITASNDDYEGVLNFGVVYDFYDPEFPQQWTVKIGIKSKK